MVWIKALHLINEVVSVKPILSFVVTFLGPGPRRLQVVKLAHELSESRASRSSGSPIPPPRVPQLRRAFPVQMREFDRMLEQELARMLNPLVAAAIPVRPRRMPPRFRGRFRDIGVTFSELAAEAARRAR